MSELRRCCICICIFQSLFLATVFECEAKWKIEKNTDPMTDSVTVILSVEGYSIDATGEKDKGVYRDAGVFRLWCKVGSVGKVVEITISLNAFGEKIEMQGEPAKSDIQLRFGREKPLRMKEWSTYNISPVHFSGNTWLNTDIFRCPDEFVSMIVERLYSGNYRRLLIRTKSPYSFHQWLMAFEINKSDRAIEKMFDQCK